MAWTFGAATGDDVTTGTLPNGIGPDNSHQLVTGWFYPTTLTAGRNYIGTNTVWGVYVNTTTSELRFKTNNTTDGEWTTSGAGITIDKWWFIAAMNACENTGDLAAWRCWVGDAETAPQEVTVNVDVALSGNFAGSSASLAIGNAGAAGATAFQGDIESVTFMQTLSSTINSMFTCATSGSISDAEAENVRKRLVDPIWRGNPERVWNLAASGWVLHIPLIEPTGPLGYLYRPDSAPIVAGTASGATFSERRSPQPFSIIPWSHNPAFKRR